VGVVYDLQHQLSDLIKEDRIGLYSQGVFVGWIRRADIVTVSTLLAGGSSVQGIITSRAEKPWQGGGGMNYAGQLTIL